MLQIADGDQKKVVGDLKPFSVKESKESHTAAAALRARLLRLPLTYALAACPLRAIRLS